MKSKNLVMFIASLVFYSFAQPVYLFLLLLSVTCNTFFGRLIGRRGEWERVVLIIAVSINLILLCTFKYVDFFTRTLNAVFGLSIPESGIALPIGISFYTFQGLSYLVDVYRDKQMRPGGFLKVGLYISLFPQLVAGPIIIYNDISEQIDSRSCNLKMTAEGVRRFIIGLSKKLLIANTLGEVVDYIYSLEGELMDFRLAWIAAVFYALQIYFDFSGYSDMAIGLGKMFGFTFRENFLYPYVSTSVKEFWRHWHISLSSWFRDYLYIPLGGNRKGRARAFFNKLIVFFCTGLWHGASWTFVIWGMWHGLFIILEDVFSFKSKRKALKIISHIYLLLVVVFGFVLFRAEDLGGAWLLISNMLAGFSFSAQSTLLIRRLLSPVVIIVLAVSVAASLPILRVLREKTGAVKAIEILSYGAAAVLMLLCMASLSAGNFNPFIYFRF